MASLWLTSSYLATCQDRGVAMPLYAVWSIFSPKTQEGFKTLVHKPMGDVTVSTSFIQLMSNTQSLPSTWIPSNNWTCQIEPGIKLNQAHWRKPDTCIYPISNPLDLNFTLFCCSPQPMMDATDLNNLTSPPWEGLISWNRHRENFSPQGDGSKFWL